MPSNYNLAGFLFFIVNIYIEDPVIVI